ncbi:MAG: prepilin peptidase [Pseudomonadota bacterium]|uniref:A24 family peptidase n=1 Tax=Phenylobacterium sp. TaxID=1871053 RepID=UPI00271D9D08|nr:prepilin peptidase [Phenylobacterium sp.]MDO9430982.1 prepilin peptidase [Phenylobacterium sp.]
MPPLIQAVLLLIFPALVIVGGLRDLTSYIIPNWISGLLILGFAPAALAVGLPLSAVGLHLGVGVAALVIGMAMFALNWIGGGDAKLFAAGALWLGWPASMEYVIVTGLAGGALTFALLGLRSPFIRPYVLSGPGWVNRLAEPKGDLPYGVAIAVGALVAFPGSALIQAWPGF